MMATRPALLAAALLVLLTGGAVAQKSKFLCRIKCGEYDSSARVISERRAAESREALIPPPSLDETKTAAISNLISPGNCVLSLKRDGGSAIKRASSAARR